MGIEYDEMLVKAKRFSRFIIPFVARVLITSAFIQDSVDIFFTLEKPTGHNPLRYFWFFYQCNIILSSLICSILIIMNKLIAPCTICLTTFSFVSLIIYHNFTDAIIITRRVSVLGGVFLLMSKGLDDKKQSFKIGLPDIPFINKSMYLELTGRIMITFLFLTQLTSINYSTHFLLKIIILLVCAAGFVMIAIGYKVRITSSIMCAVILLVNIIINPWWNYSGLIEKDIRFEYFQMEAIAGSLLLLAYNGAGELSIDEKKKIY